jgi:hypothetical protein
MSMGGAEASAPPIFFTGGKFKNLPGTLWTGTVVYFL